MLPYGGGSGNSNSSHTMMTSSASSISSHEISNNTFYAGSSGIHSLASLTARSSTGPSARKQSHDMDVSEMTPNSKAKHRYETSLGQLTKKFICLLKESPEGVSFLVSMSMSMTCGQHVAQSKFIVSLVHS